MRRRPGHIQTTTHTFRSVTKRGMTLRELSDIVQTLQATGYYPDTLVRARVNWAGGIRDLTTTTRQLDPRQLDPFPFTNAPPAAAPDQDSDQ